MVLLRLSYIHVSQVITFGTLVFRRAFLYGDVDGVGWCLLFLGRRFGRSRASGGTFLLPSCSSAFAATVFVVTVSAFLALPIIFFVSEGGVGSIVCGPLLSLCRLLAEVSAFYS